MTERASFEHEGRTLYGRDIVELSTVTEVPADIVARALLDDPPPAVQSRFKMDERVYARVGSVTEPHRLAGTVANWRQDVYNLGRWEYQVQTEWGAIWFSEELLEEWP